VNCYERARTWARPAIAEKFAFFYVCFCYL